MYLSRHAQWTEILGGQQVIWVLDIHMDFNTHSWCVLLGLILNFWVYEHSAQERALLIYDAGFEPLPLHPNTSCKTNL